MFAQVSFRSRFRAFPQTTHMNIQYDSIHVIVHVKVMGNNQPGNIQNKKLQMVTPIMVTPSAQLSGYKRELLEKMLEKLETGQKPLQTM